MNFKKLSALIIALTMTACVFSACGDDAKKEKSDDKENTKQTQKADENKKGEDVTLRAGSIVSIADGLSEVVFPTCVMKIVKNLIVIKDDVK